MHGNGVLSSDLSLQSQQRLENGFTPSTSNGGAENDEFGSSKQWKSHNHHSRSHVLTSKAALKDRGTSTTKLQEENVLAARNLALLEFGAEDSASDEERSPLWTRPAHMRNGAAKAAEDSVDLESDRVALGQGSSKLLVKGQPLAGSSLARITLTGDSKLDQPIVKIAGGGLLKVCVSEDCDLPHHFEIESSSGGKVFETPLIAPGSVFTWRPPGPGKYSCRDLLYPWIKSLITVLPTPEYCVSTASDASESQPSTPDGPLSAAESRNSAQKSSSSNAAKLAADQKGSRKRNGTEAEVASSSGGRKGLSANGSVTQTVEVDGGLGSFGVLARTSVPARGGVSQKESSQQQKQEGPSSGNEVDDLLRVPLLAKKRSKGTVGKKQLSEGHSWNESWEDSSGDEGAVSGCGLRRRAKEERGGKESSNEENAVAAVASQMRQIINPGEIDEWVERISREEEESRNVRAQEPDAEAAASSMETEQIRGSEEGEGAELKKGVKGAKKKKKKSGKKGSAEGGPSSADSGSAEPSPEETGPAFDDAMIGINRVLSSIPSTTGITHYDVSGAGMAKGGRPAKLMAIGRTPDGKMEVSPISPMMSPSSLMKAGLSNNKFSERSPLAEEDTHSYRRLSEFIDLEPGLGYMDEPRLREIKNLAGGGLPPHMGGFAMRDGGQGWSLGAPPHMAAIVPELPCRVKTCPKKFVSSVSMLRHYLQRHKKQGGELVAERPAMMAFWADLSKEEQRELLAVKDFQMQGVSGNQVSAELVQKARFRKLHGIKGAKYMTLGETLLNMVFSPLELPPTSSVDLFNALDEASEQTFLRGRTDPSVQRFVTADPARGMGDEGYLVGMLALMLEDRIVTAWMKSKEEGTLRSYQALIKEEEAALKKKQKAQQKKDRKKQKKEQPTTNAVAEANGDIGFVTMEAGTSDVSPGEEASGLLESDKGPPSEAPAVGAGTDESAESQEEDATGNPEEASGSVEQSVGEGAEKAGFETEPSLVQDGNGEPGLASSTSGGSDSAADADERVWVEREQETEPGHPVSGSGGDQAQTEAATTAAISASQQSSVEAPAEKLAEPPSFASAAPQNSADAVADPSTTRAPLLADAKAGPRLGEKGSSLPQKAIAVPVSRMGGKVKVADPSKGLQTLSTARPALTEPVVLVVTKMGPKARDGGRGILEAAKQGTRKVPGENGGLSKQVSGESAEGGAQERGSKGLESEVIAKQDSGALAQQKPVVEERPNGSEDVGAAMMSLTGVRSREGLDKEAASDRNLQDAVGPTDTVLQNESSSMADVGSSAEAQRMPSGPFAEGGASKVENTPLAASKGIGNGEVEEDADVKLQRKQSGESEGRGDGAKQGRRTRKPRGKKRGGAWSKERGEGAGEEESAGAEGEAEWNKKATRELKSLLMGSEKGRTADVIPAEAAEGEMASPIVVVQGESVGLQTAETEREANLGAPLDGSETSGMVSEWAGMASEWAGVVSAAAQQEVGRGELAGVEREGANNRETHAEQLVEAWPELGPVLKRAASSGRRKQGRRGEKDAVAGPFGWNAGTGVVDVNQGKNGPSQSGSLTTANETLPKEQHAASEVRGTEKTVSDGQADPGTGTEAGVSIDGTQKAAGETSSAAKREATWGAVGATGGSRARPGQTGMGLQEIMAFFAARWQAAVKDPEAVNLSPVGQVQLSNERAAEADSQPRDLEAVEATGWGEPGQSMTATKQDRTARLLSPDLADPGGRAQVAVEDNVTELPKDGGGWQEARTRKGGEGRGRGRDKYNSNAGAHSSAHDGRQSRKPSK